MDTSKIYKNERKMASALAKLKMGEEYRQFLIQALDPMHDNQSCSRVGWPDSEDAPSVVRKIVQTATIVGTQFTGRWDCSMVLFPWMHPHYLVSATQDGNFLAVETEHQSSLPGFLQCFCEDSGTTMSLGNVDPDMSFSLDSLTSGRNRLVGCGIEVVNTTPDMFKGGAVTVWKQPGVEAQGDTTYEVRQNATTLPVSLQLYRCPPLTSKAAATIPNSQTWEAEHGCYIVGSFNSAENPAVLPEYRGVVVREGSGIEELWSTGVQDENGNYGWSNISGGRVFTTAPILDPVTDQPFNYPASIYAPLNMSGAYFTGLSPETTLTVTLTAYVETFPHSESELISLARPSLADNRLCLEVLSRAMSTLPVAVKAGENPMGEWFARVVEALLPVAGAGLTAAGYGAAVPVVTLGAKLLTDKLVAQPKKAAKPGVKNKAPAKTQAQARSQARQAKRKGTFIK